MDNDLRMQHRDALHELIAQAMATLSKDEVRVRATQARVPAGVVLTFDEVLQDEHLAQRDFWQSVTDVAGHVIARLAWGFVSTLA